NVPLMETATQSAGIGFEYRNPINTWFVRVGYNYSGGKNDHIFNMITQPNGSTLVEALALTNKNSGNSVSASVSKLISPLKTTFKLSSNYAHNNRDMLLNNDLLKNITDTWNNTLNRSEEHTSELQSRFDIV